MRFSAIQIKLNGIELSRVSKTHQLQIKTRWPVSRSWPVNSINKLSSPPSVAEKISGLSVLFRLIHSFIFVALFGPTVVFWLTGIFSLLDDWQAAVKCTEMNHQPCLLTWESSHLLSGCKEVHTTGLLNTCAPLHINE